MKWCVNTKEKGRQEYALCTFYYFNDDIYEWAQDEIAGFEVCEFVREWSRFSLEDRQDKALKNKNFKADAKQRRTTSSKNKKKEEFEFVSFLFLFNSPFMNMVKI